MKAVRERSGKVWHVDLEKPHDFYRETLCGCCIIIGNEHRSATIPEGAKICKRCQKIVHQCNTVMGQNE